MILMMNSDSGLLFWAHPILIHVTDVAELFNRRIVTLLFLVRIPVTCIFRVLVFLKLNVRIVNVYKLSRVFFKPNLNIG